MRRCLACHALLASTSRPDRVYCCSGCRVAAHRARRHAGGPERRLRLAELVDSLEPHIAELALVDGISKAAAEDWRAAAFLLSRRFPQRWAARRRDELDGIDDELDELLGDDPA
jgi:hypothetical protein